MDRYPKPKVETPIFEITSQDRMRSCIMSLLQSVPRQQTHQQFGFDTTMLPNVKGKSMYNVETDGATAKRRLDGEHFETNCGREKKMKVNEDECSQKQLPNAEHLLAKSENQAVTRRSNFISKGQPSMNVVHDTLMGSANDNIVGANISFVGSIPMDGTDNAAMASTVHRKESSKTVCSKRYKDVMNALLKPVSSYTLLYEPHLVPTSKKTPRKKVGKSSKVASADEIKSNENPTPRKRVSAGVESADEIKSKETPTKKWDSFPNNVKTLTATGMLDGVGVKYLSASREKELRGIIKGISYLCGCKSCNYSNAVSADQFEDHAGCKTSHPNNHIYLENDLSQSLHKIVQVLKHTPTNVLCDAIQTLMGASLNQEAFSFWKESFEAASSKR